MPGNLVVQRLCIASVERKSLSNTEKWVISNNCAFLKAFFPKFPNISFLPEAQTLLKVTRSLCITDARALKLLPTCQCVCSFPSISCLEDLQKAAVGRGRSPPRFCYPSWETAPSWKNCLSCLSQLLGVSEKTIKFLYWAISEYASCWVSIFKRWLPLMYLLHSGVLKYEPCISSITPKHW